MGFVLDGLDTEDFDRQYSDRDLLKRISEYFKPHTSKMLLVAGMIFLNSLSGVGAPILISRAIDLVVENSTLSAMLLISGGVLLLGVSAWLFNYIRQYFAARIVGNVVLQLRRDVFASTINHDMSFYDEHSSGKVVSRVTSDTQGFSEVVSLTLNLLSMVLLVIILTIWLLTINVMLTLIIIAMTPVAVGIALSFRKAARRATQNARRVTAVINAQIQESVSGIIVAKNFRQEHAIYDTFGTNNRQAYRVGLQRGVVLVSIFPIMVTASGIATALLIYLGALATRSDTFWGQFSSVSPGDWYLYMQAIGYYWFPLMSIASFWSQFQDGLSASERVFALIDTESKVVQTDHQSIVGQTHASAAAVQGHIEFENVQFSYTDKEVVLPEFSLDIKSGETIALVGHTGAGKSSIAKLLTRFYEFQDGQILVDGLDIRSLNLQRFRQHIGLVPQAPFLFSGTVGENIRYGRPQATDGRCLNGRSPN